MRYGMAEWAKRIVAIEQRALEGQQPSIYAFAPSDRISTHLTEEPYFLESPFIANGKRQ